MNSKTYVAPDIYCSLTRQVGLTIQALHKSQALQELLEHHAPLVLLPQALPALPRAPRLLHLLHLLVRCCP